MPGLLIDVYNIFFKRHTKQKKVVQIYSVARFIVLYGLKTRRKYSYIHVVLNDAKCMAFLHKHVGDVLRAYLQYKCVNQKSGIVF